MPQDKKSYWLLYVAIIILLAITGYFAWQKIQIKKACDQTIAELEKTAAEKDSLQLELEQIYLQYEQLKTNNDSLNARLEREKQKVAQLMEELKRVKATDKAKIEQLKAEVALLREIMKSYIRQIDSLYQKNQILIAENRRIKEQYSVVLIEKQELEQVADSLKKTVELAKKLEARNPTFVALNKRDKVTKRISKTAKFELCFTILANKIAQTGPKKIYLRIARPDGQILINENSGTFNYQGKDIFYSAVKEINYEGKDTQVCIYYLNNTQLPPGTYTAFVFIDGEIVLTTELYLK